MSDDGPPSDRELFVGCALVEFAPVRRVSELIEFGEIRSVFTAAERRYCSASVGRLDSWAGRLAAKRAVWVALGYRHRPGLGAFLNAEVLAGTHCDPSLSCLPGMAHRPVVRLHGPVRSRLAQLELTGIDISIAHDAGVALAMAVASRGPRCQSAFANTALA